MRANIRKTAPSSGVYVNHMLLILVGYRHVKKPVATAAVNYTLPAVTLQIMRSPRQHKPAYGIAESYLRRVGLLQRQCFRQRNIAVFGNYYNIALIRHQTAIANRTADFIGTSQLPAIGTVDIGADINQSFPLRRDKHCQVVYTLPAVLRPVSNCNQLTSETRHLRQVKTNQLACNITGGFRIPDFERAAFHKPQTLLGKPNISYTQRIEICSTEAPILKMLSPAVILPIDFWDIAAVYKI